MSVIRSSPHISPRAVIIAQELCGVGVLASGSIAGAYGAASMCVHAAQGQARARPAPFAICGTIETTGKSLTFKGIPTINKRLGEICGLAKQHLKDELAAEVAEQQEGEGDDGPTHRRRSTPAEPQAADQQAAVDRPGKRRQHGVMHDMLGE